MTEENEYLHIIQMLRERLQLEANYNGNDAFVTRTKKVISSVPEETTGENTKSSKEEKTTENLPVSPSSREETLQSLKDECLHCTNCKLSQTRTKVVFGTGPVTAEVVVVGEAPGYYEDQSGEPFVGKAGQLLTKMLAAIQIDRKDAFICNVIKCRPPENRDPQIDEIQACRSWLTKQLQVLQPKIICSMGKFAAQFLTNTQQTMGSYRHKTFSYEGIPVICTYHPSYLLRNNEEKKKAWEDLKRLRVMLNELKMRTE